MVVGAKGASTKERVMKTSRKAAHLLAGSIMTAATIVGGAGIADAKPAAPVSDDKTEAVTLGYAKVEWTYTELKHGPRTPAGYLKIDDIQGESVSEAADAYYKVDVRVGG